MAQSELLYMPLQIDILNPHASSISANSTTIHLFIFKHLRIIFHIPQ